MRETQSEESGESKKYIMGGISLSGSSSKKHKQYMLSQMQERRRCFGDIAAKGDNGVVDLVAYSAAKGVVIISQTKYDLAKIPEKSPGVKQSKQALKG